MTHLHRTRRRLAVLSAAALAVGGVLTGTAAHASNDPPPAQSLARPAPDPGHDRITTATKRSKTATWKVAVIDYATSVTGAVMPTDRAAKTRMRNELTGYTRLVSDHSDKRIKVRVRVLRAEQWPGYRPESGDLDNVYDIVVHRYPRLENDAHPSYGGAEYRALAAGRWQEWPVTMRFAEEHTRRGVRVVPDLVRGPDAATMLHETLHTWTWWARDRGVITEADLPPGDVHGRPAHYPSEAAYYRDYLRGEVDMQDGSGRLYGIGVDRLVTAGTPV